MKTPLLWLLNLLLLLNINSVVGQSIKYSYDNSGNRTLRTIKLAGSSSKESPADSSMVKKLNPIEDKVGNAFIKIFPNPTRGLLHIEVQNDGSWSTIIKVFSLRGNLLITRTMDQVEADIDLSNYSNGIYILTIESGTQTVKWRIVKE